MLHTRCPVRCLTERQMCLVAINILLNGRTPHDMQFMPDEEKLPFLTWRPSGLAPWQIW